MVAIGRTGDPLVFGVDDPKAGGLTMSVGLERFGRPDTDPIRMFARRDAFRTVAESIAENVAAVPFDLYERDASNGRRKLGDREHRIAAALGSPQPTMTPSAWVNTCILDQVLHDRWATLLLTEDDGSIQFVPLPARSISFGVDVWRRVVSVLLHRSGRKPLEIPIDMVLFDVGYDPDPTGDKTRGFPVSTTLERSAMELEKGANYRDALLSGGPKVPMYVKRPAGTKWAAPDRERFKADFKAYSTDRAGQVPILEDGMELAAAPQLGGDAVEYRQNKLAAQIEFAIALRYPPELVGYRQGNFSNIAALREMLYVDVLGGRISRFRQAINSGLYRAGLLERGRFYVEENVAVRLAGNPELQASIMQTQVGAPIRTVNEARRLLNLPPVEDGDELIVPLNVIKGGLASPTDTAPKAVTRGDTMHRLELLSIDDRPDHMKAKTPAQYLAAIEKQRDRFARDLGKAFGRQAKRVLKGLGSGNAPGSLADAFDLPAETAELASVIEPHAYALALSGAATVLDRWNADRDGFDPEKLLPWISKASTGTATAINAATFAALATKLVGSEDWRGAAEAMFTGLVDADAGVWAQTIATSTTSFGANDAARVSGLGRKTWIHSGGNTSRSEHAAMDGETVDIGSLFSNGLRYPGDPTGGADENANCHCRVEYSRADD